MFPIRLRGIAALLAAGLALGGTAAPARADFYTWPVVRWFFGFGDYTGERDRVRATVPCERAQEQRLPNGTWRFICGRGDRSQVQVVIETAPAAPEAVRRVVYRWRTTQNARVGVSVPPTEEQRAMALDTLRRLAAIYVPGKADELLEVVGRPGTATMTDRGTLAAYVLLTDPEGDQFIVEFQDNNAVRIREREMADDKAGLDRCRSLIHQIPRYRDLALRERQRRRDEGNHIVYILTTEAATFVCEFYPNGYYRILASNSDNDESGVVAHGIN
jgi:hypothetical protein